MQTGARLMQRRTALLALPLLAGLSACGFRLRQSPEFAFRSLYAELGAASVLGAQLQRQLAALGQVELITEPARRPQAQVILDILQEQREKVVVGMSATGQVRELQLRLRVRFRLRTPQGKELIADTELLQQRELSFSEAFALAKQVEEEQLYRDMQSDIVRQLMRRLAAVKEL